MEKGCLDLTCLLLLPCCASRYHRLTTTTTTTTAATATTTTTTNRQKDTTAQRQKPSTTTISATQNPGAARQQRARLLTARSVRRGSLPWGFGFTDRHYVQLVAHSGESYLSAATARHRNYTQLLARAHSINSTSPAHSNYVSAASSICNSPSPSPANSNDGDAGASADAERALNDGHYSTVHCKSLFNKK